MPKKQGIFHTKNCGRRIYRSKTILRHFMISSGFLRQKNTEKTQKNRKKGAKVPLLQK
jgi:hypothetical protein